jgi:aspartate dehydrogenase
MQPSATAPGAPPAPTPALRVALVGLGAMAQALMNLLRGDPLLRFEQVVVHAASRERAQAALAAGGFGGVAVVTRLDLTTRRPDIVVECAGHAALDEHVLPALAQGVPCLVASVGALATPGLPERLEAAARAGQAQVHLVPGAIGAIDAIAAARLGGLDRVCYRGRKPPLAWRSTPAEQRVDLTTLAAEALIFEGSAREAATLYPKNANVAATLALAGLGLDRTEVRLYADPAVQQNVHQIEASGAFGSLELTLRCKTLAANPKTSALVVYSLARALRNRVQPFSI